MTPKVNKDLIILPKEEFYRLQSEEKIRRVTLWRHNYTTNQIMEKMGFKTSQAFYNMLTRLGLPTAWKDHRELWKSGKLDMGKDSYAEDMLNHPMEEPAMSTQLNTNAQPSGIQMRVALTGDIDLALLPQVIALAQEVGLTYEIKNV